MRLRFIVPLIGLLRSGQTSSCDVGLSTSVKVHNKSFLLLSDSKMDISEFVISLDGGGVRCVVQLGILERLLEVFPQLLDKATLIAGTSAGSFIAMCLAKGDFPLCRELLTRETMDTVFSRSWGECLSGGWGTWRPKYDADGVRSVLEKGFGDTTLGDLPKRCLVTTFDLMGTHNSCDPAHHNYGVQRWAPVFYDNFADSPHLDKKLSEVGLESSAAPTYFPSHGRYVDGGVVCNNPAAHAVTRLIREGALREQIAVLSIGSGNLPLSIPPEQSQSWGLLQWAPWLIYLLLDANVESSITLCEDMLGSRFHRCNPILQTEIDLDDATHFKQLEALSRKIDILPTIDYLYKVWFPELPRMLPAELDFCVTSRGPEPEKNADCTC